MAAVILADVRPRYLSCGDTAFTVEFGNEIAPGINARVMALHAAIAARQAEGGLTGLVETVPTMRSLMVTYDPLATTRAALQPAIDALVGDGPAARLAGRRVRVPCCYEGEDFAPDLADVAARAKLSPAEVVERHLASAFTVYVLGFMPGLAYVAGLDPTLYLPRRSEPRVRVPRSSVAIAMDMTTIYPFESPGGWHLIGRTPLRLFDQRRQHPVLLAPGDRLVFERIDRAAFSRLDARVTEGTLDWTDLIEAA
ncbi:MAG: 5-oxoprolinase subunit PxpB [Alphaproteobacteria bacterium]|nr:5-oxoprolinase subunit PxpB [Alphaproteobacteria bacterium]